MSTEIILSPALALQPAALFTPTPKVAKRALEFFNAQINNDHTRKAYLNATRRFAEWCDARGIGQFADVQAFHFAAFVKHLQGEFSPTTVKQHMAALRMLFDWLVTGHVLDVNPAHGGPKYVVKKGKTPVPTADEARELLESIKVVRKTRREEGPETGEPALIGLRDRALIGVMVYTFARINAVLQMKVRDYFVQGRRGWVRLHEKGGKEHEVPCHHSLEQYLDEYIAAAGIAGEPDAPLFQTAAGKTGTLTGKAMWQQDAYRMIQRRTRDTGIKSRIGNHTFRATGITAYLKNKGTLEAVQHIANHESPRTTKLYDRRQDEISLDEVERIAI
jgi:site-specific recombinase XerD